MNVIKKFLCGLCLLIGAFAPNMAFAGWGILSVDSLDISGLVPIVVDAFMFVANATYQYFVGVNHDGIIYWLVWGFLAFYIVLYAVKLFIPKFWINTFGFKMGDTVEIGGMKIAENVLKPCLRALIAVIVLLPLRPEFMAKNLINPFLSFGSLYTSEIIEIASGIEINRNSEVTCPESLADNGWLDKESCEYLIQPVQVLSRANNNVIKRGFRYLGSGLQSMLTLMIHNGGQGFMNIVTGLVLISTFISCNLFMALLIIQAIFDFGIALILYPFNIAAWVAKKSDAWFDIWPPFSGLINALKQVVIVMISCAFILCVNLALINALFSNSMFVAAANGVTVSNLPTMTSLSAGFAGHSIMWLSCILTFFLMNKIFEVTKEKLKNYVGKDATALYDQTKGDAKNAWGSIKTLPKGIKGMWGTITGK